MVNERELFIRTVVVDGTEESFKTALTRSILGVTFRKNKRYGKVFYQHRMHNVAVTQRLCDWIYEFLLAKTPLKNMSQYKIKTELVIKWNSTGKILGASDVRASIFLKMGDLSVKELKIYEEHEKVKIDFFYSTIDAASPVLREQLFEIIEAMGKENFDVTEYDFQDDNGKKMAELYSVKRVPTVVINDGKFENPDEKELRSRIELAFAPQVEANEANFALEPNTRVAAETLVSDIKSKFSN